MQDPVEQDNDKDVGTSIDIDSHQTSGFEPSDSLQEKKRKRTGDGPSPDSPSSTPEDGSATTSSTGLDGSAGDVQSVLGNKTTKRPKVVPLKEYLGRNRALKNPRGDRTATDGLVHIKQEPAQATPNDTFQHPRVERSIREVNELKAARRSEIERRCSELDPPIPPSILNHMESFQNAMQISTPLTESAWAVLKPLLLAQRSVAEEKEEERIAQSRALQARYEERRQQDAQQREAKEALDREWDDAQAPIRELLATYADDFIKDRYQEGRNLTNDTSPKFAADVLLHVRNRFYQRIADEDAATHAAGREVKRDPAKGPFTRKLILENMKWLFDTKIKPLTEQFRKELFLCHVCESSKFYGFEGVIQHYAAKHTNALSLGSIVVHWRAEWPEFSPFHPDPSTARAVYYAIPPPIHTPGLHSGPTFHPPYPPGYSQSPGPLNQFVRPGYQHFSPGPYGPVHYPGQHQHGPFAPPPSYPGPHPYPEPAPQGFPRDLANGFQAPHPGYHTSPPGAYQGSGSGYPGVNGSHHGPPPQSFASPYPSQAYPMTMSGSAVPVGQGQAPIPGSYTHPVGASPTQIQPNGYQFQGPPPPSAAPSLPGHAAKGTMYQTQLDEMAGIARKVWSGTSGIKDLPSNIRVYVVIQQVVLGFSERFSNEPNLPMFLDGLVSHPAMKAMKNANGLACKACVTGGDNLKAPFQSYPSHSPLGERKFYALPALLGHFQSVHIERGASTRPPPKEATNSRLDWKYDMVELPEMSVISDLLHAPGMDDAKLHLFAQVFPSAFPQPLPVIGRANNAGPVPAMHEAGEFPRRDGRQTWRFHDSGYVDSPRIQHGGNLDLAQEYEPLDSRSRRPSAYYARSGRPPSTEVSEYRGRDENLYGSSDRRPNSDYRSRPHRRYYGPDDLDDESRSHALANTGSSRYDEHDHPERRPGRERISTADHRYTAVMEPQEGTIEPHEMTARSRSPGVLLDQLRPDVNASRGNPLGSEIEPRAAHAGGVEVNVPRGTSPAAMHRAGVEHREAVGEGSEDGEVGTSASKEKVDASVKTGGDEISAAERFLNEFSPGLDTNSHGRTLAEQERRDEATSQNMQPVEPEADKMGRRAMQHDLEMRHKPSGSARVMIPQGSIRESPLSYYHMPSEDDKGILSSRGVIRDGQEYGGEGYAHSPGLSRPPETDPRYLGNTVMYHDERHTVEAGRRPRSRYERYESLRQERARVRSRSPRRSLHPNPEELRYHRSHVPADPRYERTYRARSPVGVYHEDYPPEGSSRHHHSAQPVARYRSYAADARVYQPTYAVPMEYVPVRRVSARSPPPPPAPRTYVVEAQAGSYARYPAYGEEVPSRAVYDDRAPVYHVDRRVYHGDESGRASYPNPRY
ncbi:MAG: hypothetical protein M1816_006908 [Peltula sp. TS41687]|nr:MAG: hypothetical protein M1816_006908 [Peltula sp. TS41687]